MRTFLAVMTVLGIALSGPVEALPANDVTKDYFTDSTHSKWIGSEELTCGGGRIIFGKTSKYVVKTSASCSDRRIAPAAYKSLARDARDRKQICYAQCYKTYGHPALCEPETCPGADALNECNAGCDAQEAPR